MYIESEIDCKLFIAWQNDSHVCLVGMKVRKSKYCRKVEVTITQCTAREPGNEVA